MRKCSLSQLAALPLLPEQCKLGSTLEVQAGRTGVLRASSKFESIRGGMRLSPDE